jgi:hypothetical protein
MGMILKRIIANRNWTNSGFGSAKRRKHPHWHRVNPTEHRIEEWNGQRFVYNPGIVWLKELPDRKISPALTIS